MEILKKELASEFVKKFPLLFTEDKEFWTEMIELLLDRYDIMKPGDEKSKELLDALICVNGVFPFHDGDFTEAESKAMILVNNCLEKYK